MKIIVDGFRIAKGSFTNPDTGLVIDYDNIVFNGRKKPVKDNMYGMESVQVKIPRKALPDGFTKAADLMQLLDQKVSFEIEGQDLKSKVYTASEFDLI